MTDEGLVRRVAWSLVIYILVAWIVLQAAGWLRVFLALPPMFETLTMGLVGVGLPIALGVAWRYPKLGIQDGHAPRQIGGPDAP